MTIFDKLDEWGPVTVLIVLVAVIAVVAGGVVVVVHPETLAFDEYLDDLKSLAVALAGLGVGRGILGAGQHVATARVQAASIASPAEPPAAPKRRSRARPPADPPAEPPVPADDLPPDAGDAPDLK